MVGQLTFTFLAFDWLISSEFDFPSEATFEMTFEATFEFPFDVRKIEDVRCLFTYLVRFQSLFRMCLVVSPCMSENTRFKTLNEYKESCLQSISAVHFRKFLSFYKERKLSTDSRVFWKIVEGSILGCVSLEPILKSAGRIFI